MNSNDKVLLLIQGPILSKGVMFNGTIVEFHSFNYIIENIHNFRLYSQGKIVLSTYEKELKQDEAIALSNLGVVVLSLDKMDTSSITTINLRNNQNSHRHGINQYYTTLHGLEELKKESSKNHVIKIRTDIKVNFSLIFNHPNDAFKKEVTLVHLRRLTKKSFLIKPFIPDFVFVGELNSLYLIFKKLYYDNFSSFVHLDIASALVHYFIGITIKYDSIILKTKATGLYSLWNLLIYYIIKIYHSILMTIWIKRKIGLLGVDFYNSIEWRGSSRQETNLLESDEIFKFN
jgi:hypothetical protein